jgi:V8-like Glu-specific endopeptidase
MFKMHPQAHGPHVRRPRVFGTSLSYAVAVATMVVAASPLPALAQGGSGAVVTAPGMGSASGIDYGNAQPMPMPQSRTAPPSLLDVLLSQQAAGIATGPASVSPGKPGNGAQTPVRLAPAKLLAVGSDDGVTSQEFGTSNHAFTTSRANVQGNQTSKFYPYSAAGKLFFNIGSSTFVCSASLIKRGIVVTAAHCVANFGRSQFYTNWRFVPAYNNGAAPFGTWTAASARVLTSYFNGTDSCAVSGVICTNDVAVITLTPQGGAYPGPRTGYLGYGVNGYSYNSSGQVLINQLGYPVALDNGALMERTDSQGFTSAGNSNNTIIGSLQTGGSSGGPWVVNLGLPPSLNGTSFGTAAAHNIVVGVTSWGYTSTLVKEQGASRFTTGNISALVSASCAVTPAACS